MYEFDEVGFNAAFKEKVLSENVYVLHKEESEGGNTELNKPITYAEVCKAIHESKKGKAVGIDSVSNELLKHDVVIKLIHCLLNVCLEKGMIPNIWCKAMINPIPKESGYVRDPLKYRGLSLQCCVYKILSSVLNCRVMDYVDSNNVLNDEQNGFRKN